MPTRYWASAGLGAVALLTACAATGAGRSGAGSRAIAITGPAGKVQVKVSADPALIDPAGEHKVKLLGTHGRLTLVLDSYSSRPQSMSRCQAGSERWVRLVDLSARAERYAKLVESCLRDVVPGDPPASWAPDGRGVTVNLLSEPSVVLGIDAAGRVSTGISNGPSNGHGAA